MITVFVKTVNLVGDSVTTRKLRYPTLDLYDCLSTPFLETISVLWWNFCMGKSSDDGGPGSLSGGNVTSGTGFGTVGP